MSNSNQPDKEHGDGLNEEEREILRSYENGEWISVLTTERKEELQRYAEHTIENFSDKERIEYLS